MRNGTKRLGRPRQYDPDKALDAASRLLWNNGLSASSLDEIAQQTGMNRPSLNAAFGSKRDLYLKAAGRYGQAMAAGLTAALDEPGLADALRSAFHGAVDRFCPGDDQYGGCFIICTAPSEVHDPAIRAALAEAIEAIDSLFLHRLKRAQTDGELPPVVAVEPLARMLAGSLHSHALRARAGADEALLRKQADGIVDLVTEMIRF